MSSDDWTQTVTPTLVMVTIGLIIGSAIALALYYSGIYQDFLQGVGYGGMSGGFVGYLASIRWRDRIRLSVTAQGAFWFGQTILAATSAFWSLSAGAMTGSRVFYLISVLMVLSELLIYSIRYKYPYAMVTLALLVAAVALCVSLTLPMFLGFVFFSGALAVKEIRQLRAGGGIG
jgi:hypothetical protein